MDSLNIVTTAYNGNKVMLKYFLKNYIKKQRTINIALKVNTEVQN